MTDEMLLTPKKPESIGLLSNSDILFGTPIPAIDRLRLVSDSEFEDIIREWILGYCSTQYVQVVRASGANDKGRDVVGYFNSTGGYDNYQCKHYDHPLHPSDVWKEIGKLCYYTFDGSYQLPRTYYFVSPQGVGPTLLTLLEKHQQLKIEFVKKWDDSCKNGIKSHVEIPLTKELREHIEKIDFSIFKHTDPQTLIEQHKKTNYYAARFGGGLKRRERPIIKKLVDDEMKLRYVEQLFEAYSDYVKDNIQTISELLPSKELFDHFNRQRECFYWADALNQFSRDSLPPENTCFEDLKEEIFQGVVDISNSIHQSGYENVQQTIQEAKRLTIQSNALIAVAQIQDKIGICHHLANENRLTWVRK